MGDQDDIAEKHAHDFAALLAEFAKRCLESARHTENRTEFEHVREAWTAFLSLSEHARAMQLLVRAGPQMYPSGWSIARSMLEIGIRTAWRMDCDNPFEAEARWLAWFKKAAVHEGKAAAAAEAQGLAEAAIRARSRSGDLEEFAKRFQLLLQGKGISVPKGEPSMRQALESLGLSEDKYQVYAEASERVHGAFVGLEAFSRHLGDAREHGHFAEWHDWYMPLVVGARGLQVLALVFARRTSTDSMASHAAWAVDSWETQRLSG